MGTGFAQSAANSREVVKTPVSVGRTSWDGCRIFVAGVGTPVGEALVRVLDSTHADVCGQRVPAAVLRDRRAMEQEFRRLQPTHVVVVAGRSGGIAANRRNP